MGHILLAFDDNKKRMTSGRERESEAKCYVKGACREAFVCCFSSRYDRCVRRPPIQSYKGWEEFSGC